MDTTDPARPRADGRPHAARPLRAASSRRLRQEPQGATPRGAEDLGVPTGDPQEWRMACQGKSWDDANLP